MTDTTRRFPLSTFQVRRIKQLTEEAAKLAQLQNEIVTAVVSAECDPAELDGWSVQVIGNSVVATKPPTEPDTHTSDTGPSLVA